jgi:hypothetical protein
MTPQAWAAWVANSDAEVRARLDRGEEDSLTNLLRFGLTYTSEYRIDDDYLLVYGESSLVNGFAERRAHDLIRALSMAKQNAGFAELRTFVEKKGYSLNSPEQRKRLQSYLLTNVARMRLDLLEARQQAKTNRTHLFEDRGISLDSNLWPDYDLDVTLQSLLKSGALKPGSVHRVAIVGPGLDFVNKQEGVDYYPPQSTQPFAVMDSLLRLGLAAPSDLKVSTLDISPRVNLHLGTAIRNARVGRSYTVQLPWYVDGRWSDDFRAKFNDYWSNLGARIGRSVEPIPIPPALPGFATRAVRVKPQFVANITPVDMNIVYQRLPLVAEEQRFDIIIGTNIFLYYGALEQALAGVNIASMLKPGGLLLSNDKLQFATSSTLKQVLVSELPMTTAPVITDYMYCYRNFPGPGAARASDREATQKTPAAKANP